MQLRLNLHERRCQLPKINYLATLKICQKRNPKYKTRNNTKWISLYYRLDVKTKTCCKFVLLNNTVMTFHNFFSLRCHIYDGHRHCHALRYIILTLQSTGALNTRYCASCFMKYAFVTTLLCCAGQLFRARCEALQTPQWFVAIVVSYKARDTRHEYLVSVKLFTRYIKPRSKSRFVSDTDRIKVHYELHASKYSVQFSYFARHARARKRRTNEGHLSKQYLFQPLKRYRHMAWFKTFFTLRCFSKFRFNYNAVLKHRRAQSAARKYCQKCTILQCRVTTCDINKIRYMAHWAIKIWEKQKQL